MPEFRNFHTTASDAFYATQQNLSAQASPAQSSDTGSLMTGADNPMRFDAGSGDMMVDVDWVSQMAFSMTPQTKLFLANMYCLKNGRRSITLRGSQLL
jgi:hypothetical protein